MLLAIFSYAADWLVRQTDRQTDRLTYRHTYRQTDKTRQYRPTERQADTQTYIE